MMIPPELRSPSTGRTARAPAFTLIEILVAMAVLALVLVLMLQVVENIMRSTRVQNQQMDSAGSARRALDILEADLRTAVISRDATILTASGGNTTDAVTNPQLSFLSHRRGPEGAADHRFLYVAYATNNAGALRRAYQSVSHGETNLLQIFSPAVESVDAVAEGILQWKVRAVTESGEKWDVSETSGSWTTDQYNGFSIPAGFQALVAPGPDFATALTNRTRAIEVWVAAADPQSYELLATQPGGPAFLAELAAADPQNWRALIDNADIPSPVKSSARILQKTIPLP